MPGGKRVTCYTCCGLGKILRGSDRREVSCGTCGGSGEVNTR